MPWFKVDDSFHSHPKVLAAAPAALGLWVVAGSWSGANLSDGFVPDHVLPRLLPDAESLARQLVAAGLWKRTRGGYRFHDWGDFNPAARDVQADRDAARERMRNLRARRKKEPVDNSRPAMITDVSAREPPDGSPEQQANVRQLFVTPTRPDPNKGVALGASPTSRARGPQCRRHRGQPADHCGPCRSEALAGGAD